MPVKLLLCTQNTKKFTESKKLKVEIIAENRKNALKRPFRQSSKSVLILF